MPLDSASERVNSHVLRPSLSRKLYNPGWHDDQHVVYGLGGPRILVSHPFKASNRQTYDVHGNASEIVADLMLRGFEGRFLFLDESGVLDELLCGVPRWLLWFSLVATQSDLVIFVTEKGTELSASQRAELSLTPPRVNKIAIEIRKLSSATDFGRPGVMAFQREHDQRIFDYSNGLLLDYISSHYPRDRYVVVDEAGDAGTLPLDLDLYRIQLVDP